MFLLTLLMACNDCSYFEQCDGDTLLVCGAGTDQLYNRKVNEVPCEGLNPVCVAFDEDYATCAVSEDACDPLALATCDGDTLYGCYLGSSTSPDAAVIVAQDCTTNGQVCAVDEATGAAACVAG